MPRPTQNASELSLVAPIPIQLTDGAIGHTHFGTNSHITDVLVGESHLVSGDSSGSYMVWPIRIVVDEASHSSIFLYKRYSDIYAFREKVVKEFPDDDIPEMPRKDSFSMARLWQSGSWLENRRKGIQWFLSNVLLNPKYQHSKVINDFVLS